MSQEKVVGKPYEGEPHVRIEVAGNGDQDTDGLVRHSQRKRGATDRSNLRPRRHSLTLPATGMRPSPQLAFASSWAVNTLEEMTKEKTVANDRLYYPRIRCMLLQPVFNL